VGAGVGVGLGSAEGEATGEAVTLLGLAKGFGLATEEGAALIASLEWVVTLKLCSQPEDPSATASADSTVTEFNVFTVPPREKTFRIQEK
jgi:hypothetical protein